MNKKLMSSVRRCFSAAALCLGLTTLVACNDDLSELGATTRPSTDGINVKTATLDLTTSTAYRDSIYVRTGYPLLGNITDPAFGSVEAGYLAQFYVSTDFGLNSYDSSDSLIFNILRTSVPAELGYDWSDYHYTSWDSLCGNRIDSVTLRIYYQTQYGDSLSPMVASVYALNDGIDFETLSNREFYSDNDFSKYYDPTNLLGSKGYTAANRELSDSLRDLSSYVPYIEIKLKDELKDRFFRAAVEAAVARDKDNPHAGECRDLFADINTFRSNLLPGVCVKNTFGDGSLIKVYYTSIYFFYSSFHRYDVDGTLLRNEDDSADSTYVTTHVKYLAVTPDVIQMSGYQFSDDRVTDRLQQPDTTYITSPQGYYTVVDLPVGKIINQMVNDEMRNPTDSSYFLNGANFYLKGYKPVGTVLNAEPAPYVLMVQQSRMNQFFEDGDLPDSETSCYAAYVADSVTNNLYYYSFGNINSVILGLAKEAGWSKSSNQPMAEDYTVPMAIIPVELTTNSTYGTVLSVSNYLLPTAMRLRRGEGVQKMQLIYTLESQR
jgi:hypothetical protein